MLDELTNIILDIWALFGMVYLTLPEELLELYSIILLVYYTPTL